MSGQEDSTLAAARGLGVVRLIVGLLQGLALYWLYRAGDNHIWPATEPFLFVPLTLVSFFVPLILIAGMGSLRRLTLVAWCAGAALVLAGLGFYDRWRLVLPKLDAHPVSGVPEVDMPSAALFFFASAALFIAHSLIAAGDAERKLVARYETYFDAGWKLGVQLFLAACFTGVFWGVLELGAALFGLIKLSFLSDLLEKAWFAIPATALAMAAALHLTDVGTKLVAGIRTVALVLLSWLLPLMTLVAVGFLVSLLFTGFKPLWETRSASALLLASAAVLVVLINAAWQNGKAEHIPAFLLRLGGSVAAVSLLPLVGIAAYALWLRVGQHGWTDDRIVASACVVVGACYALGYTAAALSGSVLRGRWMMTIAPVNIATAFVTLAVLIALLTPLADPMRLSVASQVARLHSGAVAAAKFDYSYLRWHGGRYGDAALRDLGANAKGAEAAEISRLAKAELAASAPYRLPLLTAGEIAGAITVYPKDHHLPQSLLDQDWRKEKGLSIPPCLTAIGVRCEAFFADMNGDGHDEIVFTSGGDLGWSGFVLGEDAPSHWAVVGTLSWPHCQAALEALRAGQYAVVAPDPPKWRALEAGGSRFRVEPVEPTQSCP